MNIDLEADKVDKFSKFAVHVSDGGLTKPESDSGGHKECNPNLNLTLAKRHSVSSFIAIPVRI